MVLAARVPTKLLVRYHSVSMMLGETYSPVRYDIKLTACKEVLNGKGLKHIAHKDDKNPRGSRFRAQYMSKGDKGEIYGLTCVDLGDLDVITIIFDHNSERYLLSVIETILEERSCYV